MLYLVYTFEYLFGGFWEAVANVFLQLALNKGSPPVEVAAGDKGEGNIKLLKYVTSALGEGGGAEGGVQSLEHVTATLGEGAC